MSWLLLILSSIAEALFGIATYYSRGYTQLWPSVGAVTAGASTAVLLAFAMKDLPLGVAFAVWSGLAAVGTVIFGIAFLGESRSPLQLGLIGMILAGVAGLKLISPH